ncbi:MAG: hypothetical protein KIT22_03605 [Verrucomicrobiae bacterium]|nr:hypothetical protein [Verrucomicrobiae bacterium]
MRTATFWAMAWLAAGVGAAGDVEILRLPEGAVQPQAVTDARGTVHLAWLQGDPRAADVFLWSLAEGRTNGAIPIRINQISGSAMGIGTIRGVQMAIGRDGWVHLVWNGSSGSGVDAGGASPLWYTRRKDGAGGSPERNLIGRTRHLDGGASVAADARGGVHVIWHAAPVDGSDGEEHRRVFEALSTDDGATFHPERPLELDPGVCGCCSLRAFSDREGTLWLLYRAVQAGGGRPMTLLRSAGDERRWERVMGDPWPVSQCPMSSAFLADTPAGVFAAWETRGTVRVSILPHGSPGEPSAPPASLGTKARHPALAVDARGEGVCVWSEGTGWQRGGTVSWQALGSDARPGTASGTVAGLSAWNAPAAFARPDGTWVVVF